MGLNYCSYIERHYPDAVCIIRGRRDYADIKAKAEFYQMRDGVLVCTEAVGLPKQYGKPFGFFAYHIHEGEVCAGNSDDPFAGAMAHYNPEGAPHPFHAGDLPPLFSNYGYAWNIVLVDKFTVKEVIGKVMIIHSQPDDFRTQPSGDSGEKLACGVIERV